MMPVTPSILSDLQPSSHPSSPRKSPLATALLAALAIWSLPGHAAITNVGYTLTADGTPGWDPTDGFNAIETIGSYTGETLFYYSDRKSVV